jgi:tetratricopeptide (TPR) repeat protein
MKPEHKEYILHNIDKISVKKISQNLNLKEKEIRKFLEYRKKKEKRSGFPKEIETSVPKKYVLLSIVLIIILGFAIYGNSLNGKFLYDDDILVKNNVFIKDNFHVQRIFTTDIGAGAGGAYRSYRPLQILSYIMDYKFWGLDVRGYHLTNIILHICATLAVFWLIYIFYKDLILSLLTSLLFVIHPVHTEAVSYISGRADSLAVVFLLLCFIFYIKELQHHKKSFYILMLVSYVLALLSRENSLILPVLLLLYHAHFRKSIEMKKLLPILILAVIYIVLRLTVFRTILSNDEAFTTMWVRISALFVAVTNYFRLLILPSNLHMEYGGADKTFHFVSAQAILGLLIMGSALIYAARKTKSLFSFGILWFFIALFPMSNIFPLNAFMAEHWLYLPSIGFFLILARGFVFLYRTKNLKIPALICTIALCSFFSYLTIKQNNYWREPIFFYERTLQYSPGNLRVINNLANAYHDCGRIEEAITMMKKSIEIKPDEEIGYINLGCIYQDLGRNEEAIAMLKKAIEINPDRAEAHNNLGLAYEAIGKLPEAIVSYKKAVKIRPDYAKGYNNLANIYVDLGQYTEAVDAYKKAIRINPDFAEAYHNLSVVYFRNQEYKLAIEYSDRAKELGFVNDAFSKDLEPYRGSE